MCFDLFPLIGDFFHYFIIIGWSDFASIYSLTSFFSCWRFLLLSYQSNVDPNLLQPLHLWIIVSINLCFNKDDEEYLPCTPHHVLNTFTQHVHLCSTHRPPLDPFSRILQVTYALLQYNSRGVLKYAWLNFNIKISKWINLSFRNKSWITIINYIYLIQINLWLTF
jgi:hypothetical protein